jgi:hypothetical protein
MNRPQNTTRSLNGTLAATNEGLHIPNHGGAWYRQCKHDGGRPEYKCPGFSK